MARQTVALRRVRGICDAPTLLWAPLVHLAEGCSLAETAVRVRAADWATPAGVTPMQLENYTIVATERNSLPYEGTMHVEHHLAIMPGELPDLVEPGLPIELTVRISEGDE